MLSRTATMPPSRTAKKADLRKSVTSRMAVMGPPTGTESFGCDVINHSAASVPRSAPAPMCVRQIARTLAISWPPSCEALFLVLDHRFGLIIANEWARSFSSSGHPERSDTASGLRLVTSIKNGAANIGEQRKSGPPRPGASDGVGDNPCHRNHENATASALAAFGSLAVRRWNAPWWSG